jgi:hypothetical protein
MEQKGRGAEAEIGAGTGRGAETGTGRGARVADWILICREEKYY